MPSNHFYIAEAVPGDVRLLGNIEDGVGAVEYYDSFLGWTGVCTDSFYARQWLDNTAAAMTVCRQLGYEAGSPYLERFFQRHSTQSFISSYSLSPSITS